MAGPSGNRFTREFALDVPIVQGAMGGVAGPELVAAVCNAGGLGVLPVWMLEPHLVGQAVRATQALTGRSFAVNIRADLVQVDHIRAAIDAGASIVHLFWGDPSASMAPIDEAGVPMICTVGDAEAARIAVDAGASALIAQGVEAGGHVLGETPLEVLLGSILPVAEGVPVVAAGGLVDASDVARVMALGASGALLGTRFALTVEAEAHDDYKRALLEAGADSTVRSECFDVGWPEAPHRHLKNDTYIAWDEAGRPRSGHRPGEHEAVLRMGGEALPRYSVVPALRGMTGDVRASALYAGTGVGRITDCPSVRELVTDLASML